ALSQVADAEQLAEAAAWSAVAPRAAGEVFNVANGDPTRWSHLWPAFADYFGVPAGGPRVIPLSSFMPALAPLWKQMAANYELAPARARAARELGLPRIPVRHRVRHRAGPRQDPPRRLHEAPGHNRGLLQAVRRVSPRPDHPDILTVETQGFRVKITAKNESNETESRRTRRLPWVQSGQPGVVVARMRSIWEISD